MTHNAEIDARREHEVRVWVDDDGDLNAGPCSCGAWAPERRQFIAADFKAHLARVTPPGQGDTDA